MFSDISKKAYDYKDSTIELLSKMISYPSIMADPLDGMPYGKACYDCLEFAASTLEKDGFKVRRFDGHAITADMAVGDSEPELGILCHLDVVPVDGQKWTTDPFKADIRDNRVYGRGAIDDKGPAAAIITAMRIIRDSGVQLKKGVRLILGSNEENGSADMEYYTSKESFPPMLFTPDGSFPVITIEKGMVRFELSGDADGGDIVALKGGSVVNAVPEKAYAVVKNIDRAVVKAAVGKLPEGAAAVELYDDADGLKIEVTGKGAHASTPWMGVNAMTALTALLSSLDIKGELADKLKTVSKVFPCGEWNGENAGVRFNEERSGDLTLVLSVADCADGKYKLYADCRFPVGCTSEQVVSGVKNALGGAVNAEAVMTCEPHCADEDSEMVKTLLAVYSDFTGREEKCLAIGGGTYVHDTANGVAFGAERSDDNNMHGADEFIGIDELTEDVMIYTEAILRLCM